MAWNPMASLFKQTVGLIYEGTVSNSDVWGEAKSTADTTLTVNCRYVLGTKTLRRPDGTLATTVGTIWLGADATINPNVAFVINGKTYAPVPEFITEYRGAAGEILGYRIALGYLTRGQIGVTSI